MWAIVMISTGMLKTILASAVGSGIVTFPIYLLEDWARPELGWALQYVEPALLFVMSFASVFSALMLLTMLYRWLRLLNPANKFRDLAETLDDARTITEVDEEVNPRAALRLFLKVERELDELGIPHIPVHIDMDVEAWNLHLAKLAPLSRRGDLVSARKTNP